MKKKADIIMLPTFLVRLVISLILLAIIITMFAKCTRLSAQGANQLNELAEEIENIAKDPELNKKLYSLVLDEETAIIGFTSKAEAFKINVLTKEVFGGEEEFENLANFHRPSKCEKDKACMCLCTDGLEVTESAPVDISCTSLKCVKFENLDFSEKVSLAENHIIWENGFIFARTEKEVAEWLLTLDVKRHRRSEIVLEKSKEDKKTTITLKLNI